MATELKDPAHGEVALHLQDLVLESLDTGQFLDDLAAYSAARLSSPEYEVFCGITVIGRKKSMTVASNTCARGMDEAQNSFGDGPCRTAMRDRVTVHVPDLAREDRWPDYVSTVSGQGVLSILSVPLPLAGQTRAALNLYCPQPHGFAGESIANAEAFAEQAS